MELGTGAWAKGAPLQGALVFWKARDKAIFVPELDVHAVNELAGLFNGLLIVKAFNDFRWPRNMRASINRIDAIQMALAICLQ